MNADSRTMQQPTLAPNICVFSSLTGDRIGWANRQTGEIFDDLDERLGQVEMPGGIENALCQVHDSLGTYVGDVAWQIGTALQHDAMKYELDDSYLKAIQGRESVFLGTLDPIDPLVGPAFCLLMEGREFVPRSTPALKTLLPDEVPPALSPFFGAHYRQVVVQNLAGSESVLWACNASLIEAQEQGLFGYLALTTSALYSSSSAPSGSGGVCDGEL